MFSHEDRSQHRLQVLYSLIVAKFESTKGHEICLLEGVRLQIVEILEDKNVSSGVRRAIDRYCQSNVPDGVLFGPILKSMQRLEDIGGKDNIGPRLEDVVKSACLPYQVSRSQLDELMRRIPSSDKGDSL